MKDLHELNGIATLKCNDRTIAQAVMPTHAISAEGASLGPFSSVSLLERESTISYRSGPIMCRQISGTSKVQLRLKPTRFAIRMC